MTTFDDRENAFEARFALDQEQTFKAESRRDRLLGRWAGEKLGLSGDELQAYALSVVRADMKEPGDNDVFEKVMADFTEKGVACSAQELRARMDELLATAAADVKAGR